MFCDTPQLAAGSFIGKRRNFRVYRNRGLRILAKNSGWESSTLVCFSSDCFVASFLLPVHVATSCSTAVETANRFFAAGDSGAASMIGKSFRTAWLTAGSSGISRRKSLAQSSASEVSDEWICDMLSPLCRMSGVEAIPDGHAKSQDRLHHWAGE